MGKDGSEKRKKSGQDRQKEPKEKNNRREERNKEEAEEKNENKEEALLYESPRRKPGWRFTAGSTYCHSGNSQQTGSARIDDFCTFFRLCGCIFVNDSKIFTGNASTDILKFCLLLVSLKVAIESEGKSASKGFAKIRFSPFFFKKKIKKTRKYKIFITNSRVIVKYNYSKIFRFSM